MAAPGALQYLVPSSAEVRRTERERALVMQGGYRIFDVLPVEDVFATEVAWDIEDNVTGLIPTRGPGDKFPEAPRVGMQRFKAMPTMFAQKITIPEEKLMTLAGIGRLGGPVDAGPELDRQFEAVQARLWATVAFVATRTLVDGVAFALDKSGASVRVGTYAGLDPVTPAVPWSTLATATPLSDLRGLQEAAIGTGFAFDNRAIALANTRTINRLLDNRNQADLAGKRLSGLAAPLSLADVNTVFSGQGLPQFEVCDDNYIDESGNVVMFIPDGKVLLVGYHQAFGIRAGNVQNTIYGPTGEPGIYTNIGVTQEDPKLPFGALAWNGGPAVRYRRQIRVINAY